MHQQENERVRRLGDLSGVWSTIRELDVSEIREEAEAPVTVAVIGSAAARPPLVRALRGRPGRFPTSGPDPLMEYDELLRGDRPRELQNASLIVWAIDGAQPAAPEQQRTADQLMMVAAPVAVVCLGGQRLPRMAAGEQLDLGGLPVIFVPETTPEKIAETVLPALAEHLPAEQRVAAARRLAGLREAVAREIIGDTSFSNATYALTSAIPEMIPLLNIPLNAADLLVLTKNQALMVFRLGLAYGAPGDFQALMREILPVIGSGFVWRQMARQLVGLIPGFGIVPKVAVAYAGTYAAGQAAAIWYSRGEALSKGALQQLYKQAITIGRQRAADLVARRRSKETEEPGAADVAPKQPRRGLRRFLPASKEPPAPPQK